VLTLPGLRAFRNAKFRLLAAGLAAAGALGVHLLDAVAALNNWSSTARAPVTADFNSWMASGRLLFAGASPYVPFAATSATDFIAGATHQPYPPTFFLLLTPWVLAPDALRYASWLGVQELALVTLLLATWSGLGRPSRAEAAVALALVLTFLPVRQNLFEGQANTITAALAAVAVVAWQRRRAAGGGAALALAVALKPTAGFAVLFFAYRRAARLLGALLAGLVILIAATLAAGWGRHWLPFVGLLGPLGRGTAFIANQGVNGVLLRAWRPDLAGEPITALPIAFRVAWYAAEAALALAVLAGLRRLRLPEPELAWTQFGVLAVLFGLLQPISWFHHQVGAAVLILVAVRLARLGYLRPVWAAVLLGCWALVSLAAYPIHLAARPLGGAGLYHAPLLRWGTSSAFLGFLVAVAVLAWLTGSPRREGAAPRFG
jgi:hypothetical protein